jgi:aminoglycoside phosphotransferase (APT) family kinase protein
MNESRDVMERSTGHNSRVHSNVIPAAIFDGLSAWARLRLGAAAEVADVTALGGHSGHTFGFSVLRGEGDRELQKEEFVIRLAPAGVASRGSTDVLRQAPLLRALGSRNLPVAAVCEASDDLSYFGVSFLIVTRLPGRPVMMGPEGVPSWLPASDRFAAHCLAARSLGCLHRIDVEACLPDWQPARSLSEEIDFWLPILERSRESDWIETGRRLRAQLLETAPRGTQIGLCHGDFQTNNVLFSGSGPTLSVTGIVDWEIAGVGSTGLDFAWFVMMNDAQAWHPVELRGGLDLGALTRCYEVESMRKLEHLDWYEAAACYRMAAIAAYNIRLHRSGRRPDLAWERAAQSIPFMFARGFALLQAG